MEEALGSDNIRMVKALTLLLWHLPIICIYVHVCMCMWVYKLASSSISLNLYTPFQCSSHYVFALEELIEIIT